MIPLKVSGLTKTFQRGWSRERIIAVNQLDFEVQEGEIFGFLGHNGSGKTTTIKMILGLVHPTAGTASIFNRSIQNIEVKRDVGYLPESPYFYDYLSAEEFLRFYGKLFDLTGAKLRQKIDQLLEMVSLREARHVPLRKFSKGMLQRIGIAQALINDPKLVILDEPMSGLDPIGRRDIRDIIIRLREQGSTVFFSSHILPDVEMICDRVGILVRGKLVAIGSVSELVGTESVTEIELQVAGASDVVMGEAAQLGGVVIHRGVLDSITVSDYEKVNRLMELIRGTNGHLVSLVPHKRSLEDLFLKQTGMGRA